MISRAPVEEIKSCLKLIFEMIGLRPQHFPSDEAKQVLLNFIQKNYAHKTLNEVLLAFELAITGKLDLSDSELKCYDQFTCAYFATIMESYRRWLKLQAANKQTFKPTPQLENKKSMTEDEWQEWLKDIKNYSVDIIPVAAYDKITFTPTNEQKKEFFKKAQEWYVAKIEPGTDEHRDYMRWVKEKKKDETYRILVDMSKKMIVKAYLNGLI